MKYKDQQPITELEYIDIQPDVIGEHNRTGDPFRRQLDPNIPQTMQERRVEIVQGYVEPGIDGGGDCGGVVFQSVDDTGAQHRKEFNERPLSEVYEEHDVARVHGPAVKTIQAHGSSSAYHDTDADFESRRATPGFRQRKTGGFINEKSKLEVEKERRKRNRRQR